MHERSLTLLKPFMKDLLLIIDGNAIVHRAYHAIPPLTKGDGVVVNAVYGFFSMLLILLKEQQPEYLAVCFDRSKPTIRQSMYAGYHANRPQMTSELSAQFPLIEELLTTFGVPQFSLDGYEGDDMIGTLATQAVKGGKQVLVVTGDRDMLQLVNPSVRVLMPIQGITKTVTFTPKDVEEKYGVKPVQFIDYKALIGDQSDGYPGVAGIGPKTASSLLQKYQTFENLYEHVGELPERVGLSLAQDAEQAALAKKLATIVTDAPITLHIETCTTESLQVSELRDSFEKHEFHSLLKRLDVVYPPRGEEKKKKEASSDQMSLL